MKTRDGYKEGEIVVISHGEYSDYRIRGIVRIVRDFTITEIEESLKQDFPNYGDEDDWESTEALEDGFIPWLARNGYVEVIDWQELYCGGYGFSLSVK